MDVSEPMTAIAVPDDVDVGVAKPKSIGQFDDYLDAAVSAAMASLKNTAQPEAPAATDGALPLESET